MGFKGIVWFLFFAKLLAHPSIVFVHVGPTFPSHLTSAIHQARLFNSETPIYLIGGEAAFQEFQDEYVIRVPCESLPQSEEHRQFLLQDRNTGLFRYASERFYYLEEFVSSRNLHDVFHFENDIMLYTSLSRFLPILQTRYTGKIALTLDNDKRCIPGFVYIAEPNCLQKLVSFMGSRAASGAYDMELLAAFHTATEGQWSDPLPIIIPDFPLQSATGETAKNPPIYSQYFDDFQGIFDAACLGQYWGGIDSHYHGPSTPGFINESCLFNPSFLSFSWKVDEQGRAVPYFEYEGDSFPIFNLHIHSKRLADFSSLQPSLPQPPVEPPAFEKVNYPLTAEPIDAVIVSHIFDFTLESCIERLRPYVRRIVIVSPEPFTSNAEWFAEEKFPFTLSQILEELFPGDRWKKARFQYQVKNPLLRLYQSLLRLYAPLTIPELSSNVLVLTPQTPWTAPFMTSSGTPYFSTHTLSSLTPLFAPKREKPAAHTFLLQRSILEDLFHHFREPWKSICHLEEQIISQPTFCALDLYSYFALLRTSQIEYAK